MQLSLVTVVCSGLVVARAGAAVRQFFIREPDNQTAIEGEQVQPSNQLVLQKVPSEANPKVRNHGEGPY